MPQVASKEIEIVMLDAAAIRADFPLLNDKVVGQSLHYLDNAATTHKPACVIDAIADCYRHHYGPVHRGLYPLAEDASSRYEQARARVARFIGAPAPEQLIFTRSTTESINMVARGWAHSRLRAGDEVWVSRMEHHANFLPWQAICRETGARLRIIELQDDGSLDITGASGLFGPRTKLIAISHVSNVLGVINPIRAIVEQARARAIPVLVDAAQSAGHIALNVAELNCDFLAFSAHKIFGPSGIGVLYAKAKRLQEMEPLLLGGGMVDSVGATESVWAPYPAKFEAGSPSLADALGFAAAVGYIENTGIDALHAHVSQLTQQALQALMQLPGVDIYGPREVERRAGIIAFNVAGVHPHDVAQTAGEHGVAIRAGHHCCQPLMQHFGVAGMVRASFAPYNRSADIEALVESVAMTRKLYAL
ncbi:MAG: cysteine desulfurase [Betaproteobacteria bacterium HGW-Betaproteobacteria-11]|nr:MAG: cysteine desulfurase [Betaproteobacteria bacterium HGW-Betaproteobacteria-11]